MLTIDITKSPPTRQELHAEKERLSQLKKQHLQSALMSDLGHGSALLLFFFFDILSASGLLTVITLGTLLMFSLLGRRRQLAKGGLIPVIAIALFAALVTGGILYGFLDEGLTGSLASALLTASTVFCSTLIGIRLLDVLSALAGLESLVEDEAAEKELSRLCRANPLLEDYRQQAAEILRPHLTYAELEAMQSWHRKRSVPDA